MKSDMKAIADEIQEKLLDMGFTVHRLDAYTTNSVYLKVDCGVCHSIRVSDHNGKEHLKFRYNIGTFVKKFRSVNDMYRRYYFTVDEVDRLVKFVKYDRVRAIDVLGGRKAYREQVQRFRKRGEAMTEVFWTKCWEVAMDGEQEADADAARLGEDVGGKVSGTQRAKHRVEG
jgi:hypothetical protein